MVKIEGKVDTSTSVGSEENVVANKPPEADSNHRLLLPNTTQVPNVILDRWLAFLSGSATKVVLYVARRTYGFGRTTDRISINQMVDGITKRDGSRLDYGTGLGRSTVISTVNKLVREGILIKHPSKSLDGSDQASEISLNLSSEPSEFTLYARGKGRNRVLKSTSKVSEDEGTQASYSRVSKTGPSLSKNWTPGVSKTDPQNQVSQNPDIKNQELKIDRRARSEKADRPWSVLDTEVGRVPDSSVCSEADRLADQLVALVDVRRDLARRLAQLSVERREADMLVRVALRVADTEPNYPWPALLTAIINAREEEGGRR